METYLVMLLVTAEQEGAIQYLFGQRGWKYCKTGSRPALKEELDMLYGGTMEHKTTNIFSGGSYFGGVETQQQFTPLPIRNPLMPYGVQDLSRSSVMSFCELYPGSYSSTRFSESLLPLSASPSVVSETPTSSASAGYWNNFHVGRESVPKSSGGQEELPSREAASFPAVVMSSHSDISSIQSMKSASSVICQGIESNWQNASSVYTITSSTLQASSSSSASSDVSPEESVASSIVEPILNPSYVQMSNAPLKSVTDTVPKSNAFSTDCSTNAMNHGDGDHAHKETISENSSKDKGLFDISDVNSHIPAGLDYQFTDHNSVQEDNHILSNSQNLRISPLPSPVLRSDNSVVNITPADVEKSKLDMGKEELDNKVCDDTQVGLSDGISNLHGCYKKGQDIDSCFISLTDVIKNNILTNKEDELKMKLIEEELGKALKLLTSGSQINITAHDAVNSSSHTAENASIKTLQEALHDISEDSAVEKGKVMCVDTNEEDTYPMLTGNLSQNLQDVFPSDVGEDETNVDMKEECQAYDVKIEQAKSRKSRKTSCKRQKVGKNINKVDCTKKKQCTTNDRRREKIVAHVEKVNTDMLGVKNDEDESIEGEELNFVDQVKVKANSSVHHRWAVNRNLRMHGFHRKCTNTPTDLDKDCYSISENGYYCKDCAYIFKSKNKLNLHKELKGGYCSPYCIYCFKDELKDIFQCSKCHKCFITKELLERHEEKHNPNAFVCKFCDAGFYTGADLKHHLQVYHIEDIQVTYLCDLCGSKFSEKKVLNAHRKYVHTNDRPEECPTCSRRFKTKSQLKNHLVVHKKASDFNLSCEVCGKMFLRNATLKDHVKRHKKEFSFFCSLCNKGFYRKHSMDEHMRIHTGVKPFVCKQCGYKCALSCNLSKHMKVHQKQWQSL